MVKIEVEGGPRGLCDGEDQKEKTEFCGECMESVGHGIVEGAIGVIGARTGGEGSSRMQFDDSNQL